MNKRMNIRKKIENGERQTDRQICKHNTVKCFTSPQSSDTLLSKGTLVVTGHAKMGRSVDDNDKRTHSLTYSPEWSRLLLGVRASSFRDLLFPSSRPYKFKSAETRK